MKEWIVVWTGDNRSVNYVVNNGVENEGDIVGSTIRDGAECPYIGVI